MKSREPDGPRFPALWLVLMSVGLGGSVAVREVATQNGMSAGTYWAWVLAFGLVFGAAAFPFWTRFSAWTQARKASGRSTWWERLP
ncbi:MAG TPA: hypothetical protein VFR87_11770 [Nocardioidaceae bacterium]|nr:hypothetical protein [Nocardioidaceae bacterium]